MASVNKKNKCLNIITAAGELAIPAVAISTTNCGIYVNTDGDLTFIQGGKRKLSIGGSFALYNDSNQKNISVFVLNPTIPAGTGPYDIAQISFTADANLLMNITACTTTGKHIIATYYLMQVSGVLASNMLFTNSRSLVTVTTDTAIHFSVDRGAEQNATVKIELTGTETDIARCIVI